MRWPKGRLNDSRRCFRAVRKRESECKRRRLARANAGRLGRRAKRGRLIYSGKSFGTVWESNIEGRRSTRWLVSGLADGRDGFDTVR